MSSSPRSTSVSGRFDALDTLRCLAVLVMVQGHAFYLVIDDGVRGEAWYSWHNYIHGYTAPAFLFGAGLAFGVTTLRALSAHAAAGPTLYKRVYRYLALFAIGYALQLPPLGQDPVTWTDAHLRVFSRVEALQHIAAALLFCQLAVVLVRRRWPFVALVTLAGLFVVLIGPWVSRVPQSALGSQAVAAYISTEAGSTFPIIPWAGFVLLGVTVASVLPDSTLRGPRWQIALAFLAGGVALVLLSLGLDVWAPGVFGEHFYWKVSPYFFLRRLGWVLVMLGAFAGIDFVFFRKREAGPVRRWVRLISQQSLVAYVAHLVLLYGSPFNHGIRTHLFHNMDVWGASLLVAGICLALSVLASVWRSLERHWDAPFLFVRRTAVAVMAILVVTAGLRTAASPPAPVVAEAVIIRPSAGATLDADAASLHPTAEGELAGGELGEGARAVKVIVGGAVVGGEGTVAEGVIAGAPLNAAKTVLR